FVAFGVLDFIHTDGSDGSERAMLQAPGDDVLDRIANLFPGGAKGLGGFLPGELAGPARQKQHIGPGQLVLAIGPRNLFDQHATVRAVDAPHAVQQEDPKAPARDELKARFGKGAVTGGGFLATGAERGRPRAGPDGNFNGFLVRTEASMLVDESPKMVALV